MSEIEWFEHGVNQVEDTGSFRSSSLFRSFGCEQTVGFVSLEWIFAHPALFTLAEDHEAFKTTPEKFCSLLAGW